MWLWLWLRSRIWYRVGVFVTYIMPRNLASSIEKRTPSRAQARAWNTQHRAMMGATVAMVAMTALEVVKRPGIIAGIV